MSMSAPPNHLYYGDCLPIMVEMPEESVDLIYLDPPFNSKRNYNAIYQDETGLPLPEQIEAFCDTWEMTSERERAIRNMPRMMLEHKIENAEMQSWVALIEGLRHTRPDMRAYLSYMTERLIAMKRLLKPKGSIYLHCDPTASHYFKLVMDWIFGYKNYRNEIIWGYRTGGVSKRYFAHKHDIILSYGKDATKTYFLPKKERIIYKKPFFSAKRDEQGRFYADVYIRDVWDNEDELKPVINVSAERTGYPTQKPEGLLRRIIETSSERGDLVLDPFSGCATTLKAAHRLGRRWIGIDIAFHAIKRVTKVELGEKFNLKEDTDYTLTGVPLTLEGAQALWRKDPYHFQKWAVEQVDGFVTIKRSGDGGMDGHIYYHPKTANERLLHSMALEVKGGKNVGIDVLDRLFGVVEATPSVGLGGLIVMEPLGSIQMKNFRQNIANAGSVTINGEEFDKLQILSVPEILDGARFRTPRPIGQKPSDSQKSMLV